MNEIIDAIRAREIALRHIKVCEHLKIISDKIFEIANYGKFEYTYKISKDEIGNLVVSDICFTLKDSFWYKTSWELTPDGFYLIHISWEQEEKKGR